MNNSRRRPDPWLRAKGSHRALDGNFQIRQWVLCLLISWKESLWSYPLWRCQHVQLTWLSDIKPKVFLPSAWESLLQAWGIILSTQEKAGWCSRPQLGERVNFFLKSLKWIFFFCMSRKKKKKMCCFWGNISGFLPRYFLMPLWSCQSLSCMISPPSYDLLIPDHGGLALRTPSAFPPI